MATFILTSRANVCFALVNRSRVMVADALTNAVVRFDSLYPAEHLVDIREATIEEVAARRQAEAVINRPTEF
jgi:hypothetical protein